jgi:hypothetical protein
LSQIAIHNKVRHPILVGVFVAFILISNLRFSSMYVYYSIDREGFIERLCENKDKPELKCDGKCMLAQMLRAQSAEDEQPMPMIGWEQILVFLVKLPDFQLHKSVNPDAECHRYTNHYSFRFSNVLNKPPIV